MELDKIIVSRHSIREYANKDIDYKLIGKILDIAKNAPSTSNVQNCRFIIVKDNKAREKIAMACLDQLWMTSAPMHLVICYDERNIKTVFPKEYIEYSIQNASIIATLIMLKATELNLGTCWVAISDHKLIASILKLPDFIIPSVVITMGYPSGHYKKTKRNSIEILTHFEAYGKKQVDTSTFPLSKYAKKLESKIKSKTK